MSVARSHRAGRAFPLSFLSTVLLILLCPNGYGQNDSSKVSEEEQPIVSHRLVMITSLGEIEFELYGKEAPMTVANFIGLSDSGFYNGILFHRVHPGFVIQAGDPNTKDSTKREQWGTGGNSIYNGPFPDELDPTAPGYKMGYRRGTLAMANNGPNTNTSQFFILLNDIPNMPRLYTIFGRVTGGMDVVDTIANSELAELSEYGGIPKTPILIFTTQAITEETGSEASGLSDPND